MKPSSKFLGSLFFLSVSSPCVQAAGNIRIGGIETNITAVSPYSPLVPGSDAVVSNLTVTGALAGGSIAVTTTTGGITVKDAVGWSTPNVLTLDGQSSVVVSAALNSSGGGTLSLISHAGSIDLNGTVETSGSGGALTATAATGITQDAGHVLTVTGLATLDAGAANIVLTENNSFGSLKLTGGAVAIHEKDSTNFAGADVGSLDFTSAGVVGQSGALHVTGAAKIDAGANNVVLADAGNSFGSIAVNGGAITINEADATNLTGVTGASLTVTSGGVIGNSGDLAVTGLASFAGSSLALGSGSGTAAVGSLNFNAAGDVTARLVAGTTLTGTNTAGNFLWNTDGTATIAVGGKVTATSAGIQKGAIALSGNNQLAVGTLTVETGASLQLGAFNNTVTTYNQNDGATLAGSGTLTAASYNLNGGAVNANLGAGSLNQIGNTSILTGASGASSVKITGGALALGSADRLADNAAVQVATGTLDIAAFDDRVGSYTQKTGGILAGNGTLSAGTYSLGGGTVDANLGLGALTQTGDFTTLNGAAAATTVTMTGGTLRLGAADRLADDAAVQLNGGSLDLAAFDETVKSLATTAGSLSGTGTLTAANYQLGGGTVDANLGAGALTQTGGSTVLNGRSAAATIDIQGGALLLGTADRLADGAALQVAGGSLDLGNSIETVGNFTISSGSLDGTGTLTATEYRLGGGTVNANLGAGSLSQTGGTTTLNGTSKSLVISVNGGTLRLGNAERLAGGGSVTVAAGATLDVGNFHQAAGAFSLNGGTLDGSGTLSTAVYDLRGGLVNANLGGGILSQAAGVTTLNGSSAAASVRVDAGTLKLGVSGRMDDAAQVIVASAATLDLGATSDTVGSLEMNFATLNGSGTLTAGTYQLRGAVVNANLGAGSLGQLESTTTLNGTSAAGTVNIQGGNLVLGSSERLDNGATVTLRNATVLDLGNFTETVGSVTLRSGIIAGTGTLAAASYDLGGGAVNANLGTGILAQTGGLTILNGTSAASTVNISGGFLQFGAADRLADSAILNIRSGSLEMGNFADTVGTVNLNSGQLNGAATLTAATYNLSGGAVNANLGAGTLNQLAGVTTLAGVSAARSINVSGGSLALASADRLDDGAAVRVSGGDLDVGAFGDTVASYSQTGGVLSGAGGLRVTGGINLSGGEVAGVLLGKTTIRGPVTVSGTIGGGAIKVKRGSLTLDGAAKGNVKINKQGKLGGTGTIAGKVKSNGAIAVNSANGELTITGSLVTKGKITLNLKNRRNFESIAARSIKFGGKLIIKNTGRGLKYGQQVQLFDAKNFSESFHKIKTVGFGQYVVFDADTGILTSLGDKEGGSGSRSVAKTAPIPVTTMNIDFADAVLRVLPFLPLDPVDFNGFSPEVHRGMADYSEESIGNHVRQATGAAPVTTAGGLQIFASTSGVDGSVSNAGYDIDSYGVTAGVRGDVAKNVTAGGFIGFDDGSIKGNLIDTDARGFLLGAFGSLLLDTSARTRLTASAAFGTYQYDATRHASFGDVRADDIDSHVFDFSLGIETVVFEKNGFRITPGAALRYTTGKVDGFTERGRGFPLSVDSQDIDSTQLDLAVNFDYEVNKQFSLAGSLGYNFELGNSEEPVSARFTRPGSPEFSVDSPGIDNEGFVLGLGANYDIDANTRIGVSYLGEFRTDSKDAHSIGLGVSHSF